MLLRHYSGGMTLETLSFDQVSADDPSVTGPEYVVVQADSLPELEGDHAWWKGPPPSGESILSGAQTPSAGSNSDIADFFAPEIAPEGKQEKDAAGRSSASTEPAIRSASASATGSGSKISTAPLNAGNAGTVQTTKRKAYKTRQEEKSPRPKRQRRKAKSKMIISSDEEHEIETGPSTGAKSKGKGKSQVPREPEEPEEPKVCDQSRERTNVAHT